MTFMWLLSKAASSKESLVFGASALCSANFLVKVSLTMQILTLSLHSLLRKLIVFTVCKHENICIHSRASDTQYTE